MTHRDEPDGSAQRPGPAPSRRSVLRATAGAGAAGLAATAFGRTVSGAGTHAAAAEAARPHEIGGEPVVVHVRDVSTGEIDVFRGTTQTRVHDRALALSIVRASR
jgi:hypothetical protein